LLYFEKSNIIFFDVFRSSELLGHRKMVEIGIHGNLNQCKYVIVHETKIEVFEKQINIV